MAAVTACFVCSVLSSIAESWGKGHLIVPSAFHERERVRVSVCVSLQRVEIRAGL